MSGSERAVPPTSPIPRWLSVPLVAVLSAVVGFGLVGLVFADLGAFMPVLVVPLGAAAAIVFFRLARPGALEAAHGRTDSLAAFGAVAVAAGSLLVNLRHVAQHLLIDRDPGAYLNTGRWLATHHGLVFRARVGPFATVTGIKYKSPAVYGNGGSMTFQFSHLFGVLLAQARWLGGDHFMFAFTPVLGALSILVFYALACRFVRPWLALAATLALAANVVQLHFSRDAYSEIVVQLVLLASVWLLSLPRLDASRAVFGGVLLGTTVAARIDGPLYLAALPVLAGIVAARQRPGAGAGAGAGAAADGDDGIRPDIVNRLAIAAVSVAVLGLLDVLVRVPGYAGSLASRLAAEYVAMILLTIVAIRLGRRGPAWLDRLARERRLPAVVGGAFGALLLAMWFVRPHLQQTHGKALAVVGDIQLAHHLAVDRGLRYYQNSLQWHSWYLGPAALTAGIAGIGLLLRDTIRKGTIATWILVIGFVGAGGLYLWNASITPDQLWVTRRFVPIVIPGFLLFGVLVCELVVRRSPRLGLAPVAVFVALLVAWPLSATLPVRDEMTQPGMLAAVEATCRALGPDAAVVVLNGGSELYRQIPQALRGFCNVPVAIREDTFDDHNFAALARRWRANGRVLKVFAESPAHITRVLPNAQPRTVARPTNDRLLDQTLDRPPRHYISRVDTFVIATVPVD